jgi:hypothetical protein
MVNGDGITPGTLAGRHRLLTAPAHVLAAATGVRKPYYFQTRVINASLQLFTIIFVAIPQSVVFDTLSISNNSMFLARALLKSCLYPVVVVELAMAGSLFWRPYGRTKSKSAAVNEYIPHDGKYRP